MIIQFNNFGPLAGRCLCGPRMLPLFPPQSEREAYLGLSNHTPAETPAPAAPAARAKDEKDCNIPAAPEKADTKPDSFISEGGAPLKSDAAPASNAWPARTSATSHLVGNPLAIHPSYSDMALLPATAGLRRGAVTWAGGEAPAMSSSAPFSISLPALLDLGDVVLSESYTLRKFSLTNLTDSELTVSVSSNLGEQIGYQEENENIRDEDDADPSDHNELFNVINYVESVKLAPLGSKALVLAFRPLPREASASGNIDSKSLLYKSDGDDYTRGPSSRSNAYFTVRGRLVFRLVQTGPALTEESVSVRLAAQVCRSVLKTDVNELLFDGCLVGQEYQRDFTVWNRSQMPLRFVMRKSLGAADQCLQFHNHGTGQPITSSSCCEIPSYSHLRLRVTYHPLEKLANGRSTESSSYLVALENLNDSQNVETVCVSTVLLSTTHGKQTVEDYHTESLHTSCGEVLDFGDCYNLMDTSQTLTIRNITQEQLDVQLTTDCPAEVRFNLHTGVTRRQGVVKVLDAVSQGSDSDSSTSSDEGFPEPEALSVHSAVPESSSVIPGAHVTRVLDVESAGDPSTQKQQAGKLQKQWDEEDESMRFKKKRIRPTDRIEELTLPPGKDKTIVVWYTPNSNRVSGSNIQPSQLHRTEAKSLQMRPRLFKVFLKSTVSGTDHTSTRAPQQIKPKVLQGRARVCTSIVSLHGRSSELNFGDSVVNTTANKCIQIDNVSEIPARLAVKMNSQSMELLSPETFVIPPKQSYEVRFAFSPQRVNPHYRKQVTVVNLKNPENSCMIHVLANNVDQPSVASFHNQFYRHSAHNADIQQHANAKGNVKGAGHRGDRAKATPLWDNIVVNCPSLHAFSLKNITSAPIRVKLQTSSPEIELFTFHSVDDQTYIHGHSSTALTEAVDVSEFSAQMTDPVDFAKGTGSSVSQVKGPEAWVVEEHVTLKDRLLDSWVMDQQEIPSRSHKRWAGQPSSSGIRENAGTVTATAAGAGVGNGKPPSPSKGSVTVTGTGDVGSVDDARRSTVQLSSVTSYLHDLNKKSRTTMSFVDAEAESNFVANFVEKKSVLMNIVRAEFDEGRLYPVSSEQDGVLIPPESGLNVYALVTLSTNGMLRPTYPGRFQTIHGNIFVTLLSHGAPAPGSSIPSSYPTPDEARAIPIKIRACLSQMELMQRNIHFGNLAKNEERMTQVILHNKSEAPLLYKVKKSGSYASFDISIHKGRVGVIPPLGTKQMSLVFQPSFAGAFQETFDVVNLQDVKNQHGVTVKANIRSTRTFYLQSLECPFLPCFLNPRGGSSALSTSAQVTVDTQFQHSRPQRMCLTNESKISRWFELRAPDAECKSALLKWSFTFKLQTTRRADNNMSETKREEEIERLEQKLKINERKGKAAKVVKIKDKLKKLRGGADVGSMSDTTDDSASEDESQRSSSFRNSTATNHMNNSISFLLKPNMTQVVVVTCSVRFATTADDYYSKASRDPSFTTEKIVGVIKVSEARNRNSYKDVSYSMDVFFNPAAYRDATAHLEESTPVESSASLTQAWTPAPTPTLGPSTSRANAMPFQVAIVGRGGLPPGVDTQRHPRANPLICELQHPLSFRTVFNKSTFSDLHTASELRVTNSEDADLFVDVTWQPDLLPFELRPLGDVVQQHEGVKTSDDCQEMAKSLKARYDFACRASDFVEVTGEKSSTQIKLPPGKSFNLQLKLLLLLETSNWTGKSASVSAVSKSLSHSEESGKQLLDSLRGGSERLGVLRLSVPSDTVSACINVEVKTADIVRFSLSANPERIDLRQVLVDQPITTSFTLANGSALPVSFVLMSNHASSASEGSVLPPESASLHLGCNHGVIPAFSQTTIDLTCSATQPGRQVYSITVRNLKTQATFSVPITMNVCRPSFVDFPTLTDDHLQMGSCYVAAPGNNSAGTEYAKVSPLVIRNVQSKPLYIGVGTNMSSQVFVFQDEALTLPADDLALPGLSQLTVHVCLRPRYDGSGQCRELVGGIRVSVRLTPEEEAISESKVKLTAVVGSSVLRLSTHFVDHGTVPQQQLGQTIQGDFMIQNMATLLPASFKIVTSSRLGVSVSECQLGQRDSVEDSCTVKYSLRTEEYGLFEERIEIVNLNNANEHQTLIVRLFCDDSSLTVEADDASSGVVHFANTYISLSPEVDTLCLDEAWLCGAAAHQLIVLQNKSLKPATVIPLSDCAFVMVTEQTVWKEVTQVAPAGEIVRELWKRHTKLSHATNALDGKLVTAGSTFDIAVGGQTKLVVSLLALPKMNALSNLSKYKVSSFSAMLTFRQSSSADPVSRELGHTLKVFEVTGDCCISVGQLVEEDIRLGRFGPDTKWQDISFKFTVRNLSSIPLVLQAGQIDSCIAIEWPTPAQEMTDTIRPSGDSGVLTVPPHDAATVNGTFHTNVFKMSGEAGEISMQVCLINVHNPENVLTLRLSSEQTPKQVHLDGLSESETVAEGSFLDLPPLVVPGGTADPCASWFAVENTSSEPVQVSAEIQLSDELRDVLVGNVINRSNDSSLSAKAVSVAPGDVLEVKVLVAEDTQSANAALQVPFSQAPLLLGWVKVVVDECESDIVPLYAKVLVGRTFELSLSQLQFCVNPKRNELDRPAEMDHFMIKNRSSTAPLNFEAKPRYSSHLPIELTCETSTSSVPPNQSAKVLVFCKSKGEGDASPNELQALLDAEVEIVVTDLLHGRIVDIIAVNLYLTEEESGPLHGGRRRLDDEQRTPGPKMAAVDGPSFNKGALKAQGVLELNGCASVPGSDNRFEIHLGQQNHDTGTIEWPFTLENPSSSVLGFVVSMMGEGMQQDGHVWLSTNITSGQLRPGDTADVMVSLSTDKIGFYSTYLLVQCTDNPGDLKIISVSMQVVASHRLLVDLSEDFFFSVQVHGGDTQGDDSNSRERSRVLEMGNLMLNRLHSSHSFMVNNTSAMQLDFIMSTDLSPSDGELYFSLSRTEMKLFTTLSIGPQASERLFILFIPTMPTNAAHASDGRPSIGCKIFVDCPTVKDHREVIHVEADVFNPQFAVSSEEMQFSVDFASLTFPQVLPLPGQAKQCMVTNISTEPLSLVLFHHSLFFRAKMLDSASQQAVSGQSDCFNFTPGQSRVLEVALNVQSLLDNVEQLQRFKYSDDFCAVYNANQPDDRLWIKLQLSLGAIRNIPVYQPVSAFDGWPASFLEERILGFLSEFSAGVQAMQASAYEPAFNLDLRILTDILVFYGLKGSRAQGSLRVFSLATLLFQTLVAFMSRMGASQVICKQVNDTLRYFLGFFPQRIAILSTLRASLT